LAIVSDKEKAHAEVYAALRYTLPLLGIAVGLLALLAVTGAVSALRDLKALWNREKFPAAYDLYPRPFGTPRHHAFGVYYSQGLPLVVVIAWFRILLVFYAAGPAPAPQRARLGGLNQSSFTTDPRRPPPVATRAAAHVPAAQPFPTSDHVNLF
ncbi:MAG: hypothetical protein LC745_12855, partial [Planctomycetia bacterium]|nr:hypothetical protein [Planctomycetia bacterium]